jgi:hypothetical protein
MKLKLKSKLSFTRRWRNARPGSVLILVVALLVLLALIGTAYLSATQAERYTSGQNTVNTEADLLLQGLVDTVNARVAGGLFDNSGSQFRPPQSIATTISNGYNHFDSSTTDNFLGDRLPTSYGATGAIWNQISWPIFTDPSGHYSFDSPLPNDPSIQLGTGTGLTKYGFGPYTVPNPTTYSPKLAPNGTIVPSLMIGTNTPIMAADTDGDGIADSGLVKLPIGPIDGITYYCATRIIDANSAINVNTALSSVSDFAINASGSLAYVDGLGATTTISSTYTNTTQTTPTPVSVQQGTMPYASAALGMFPSHVGLMQMLSDYTYNGTTYDSLDAENVLKYMAQFPSAINPLVDGYYQWDKADGDFQPSNRSDFNFISVGDHLNAQIARRINYPGFMTYNGQTPYQHQAFKLADSAALASGFCIRNPSRALSDIETQMPDSVGLNNPYIPTSPFTATNPNSLASWYSSIPQAFVPGNKLPVRTLLTTSNPVSDSIPIHYVVNPTNPVDVPNPEMLPYLPYIANSSPTPPYIPAYYSATTTYSPGQFVLYTDPNFVSQPVRCYVCVKIASNNPPIPLSNSTPKVSQLDTDHWRPEEAWTSTPQKANINTADFPTLWRAFYNVMADTGSTIPPLPGGNTPIPYSSQGWGPFRNPVRSAIPAKPPAAPPVNALTSGQVLQLRSAIAAINAMDMRNGGPAGANGGVFNDVSSRTFSLYPDATHTTPAFNVTVFGMKNQPFISAVVADYDGTNPTSLSIEIYNPTDVTIDIGNWQLAAIVRKANTNGQLTLQPIAKTVSQPAVPQATLLKAGQFLIFQSAVPNMTAATGESAITLKGMEVAADPGAPLEVVLLRPRRGDGTYTTPNPAVFDNNYPGEGTPSSPTLDQLMPVDSIDFTGVFTVGPSGAGRKVYERPHGITANSKIHYNWDFVYPGKYDAIDGGGTNQTGWGALLPSGGTVIGGAPSSDGTISGGNNKATFQPIQLSSSKLLSPTPITTTSGNKYPFSGFARNGDILKVPFIGAYVIHPVTAAVTPPPPGSYYIVEMNSVTMDASQATATPIGMYETTQGTALPLAMVSQTTADEAIGRFCPLAALDPGQGVNGTGLYVGTNADPYGWAAHIFDYLDVNVASDDFFPNADPRLVDGSINVTAPTVNYSYTNTTTVAPPVAVANNSSIANSSSIGANGNADANLGKQGLININTAPAYVLQQLPGVSPTMAAAIVAERSGKNGPFLTIFDLNRVVPTTFSNYASPYNGCFQTREGNIQLYSPVPATPPATSNSVAFDQDLNKDPGAPEGDYTPGVTSQTDGVRSDFEEQTLMLTRISNLITVRSDMFTCYVLLQGWRNAGTSTATLAVQRRAAFLLDRGTVTPTWIPLPNNRPFNFAVPTGSN